MTTSLSRSRDAWHQHPSVAHVDDYLWGGDEHFLADRELADRLLRVAPWLSDMVRINRLHGHHVVTALAHKGIRQILNLGCGLPPHINQRKRHDPPTTFESASAVHAAPPRVVYVDSDPVVYGHANMVLAEHKGTAAVRADIRQMDQLLTHPQLQLLDHSEPILVLAHNLLTWVNHEAAEEAMTCLRGWLPAGSYISVTHATTDMDPKTMKALANHYVDAGIDFQPRSGAQIQALLGPWALVPPGIVPTAQ
ncbi:SAM-dependent methyltransferase [Streptomyces lydicus]|uniref:SAM-dependent methyltransferase n=1 Tax=Streptomyces lydicus TaxID=47763 RepID=UPI0010137734|nr:SAM-dependent methyltransferase [Streptomyces lydicus]MCZ1012224.1 SAM-dependent methyltransferase [Streptomyces lydicus]